MERKDLERLKEHPRITASPADHGERAEPRGRPASLRPRVAQRCLHLFAGRSRAGDVAEALSRLGWTCVDVDILRKDDKDQDVLCDAAWARWTSRLKSGEFGFVLAGTPCSSFSATRNHPGGPPPVRSAQHIEGLPTLRGAHKEEVRKANVLAARTAEACDIVASLGGGFAVENPEPREDQPSLFRMPALKALASKHGAKMASFDQCMYGSPSTKPTSILYHRGGFVLLRDRCNHPRRWRQDPEGNWIKTAHDSIWGKREGEEWASRAAAQYPPALCTALAKCIAVVQPVRAEEDARARGSRPGGAP